MPHLMNSVSSPDTTARSEPVAGSTSSTLRATQIPPTLAAGQAQQKMHGGLQNDDNQQGNLLQ